MFWQFLHYVIYSCHKSKRKKVFKSISFWYIFFWVFSRRLNIKSRRFGTLSRFHPHRRVGVNVNMNVLSSGYFPGVWILKADVSEHSVGSIFTHPPVKMELKECSEKSAFNIQTPGKYPEENIPYVEFYSKNKFLKLVHLVGFIIRI
jgi:hypothetical protein